MIGGLVPCSFIDFRGTLSAVVFLRGCNLRCPYCHNASLLDIAGPSPLGSSDLLRLLETRRGRLGGVVFSGGEPTLRPELRSLIVAARDLGFAIKLDTNGTRPDVLADLLKARLLDYVAMDLKDEPEAYPDWLDLREDPAALVQSLRLLACSGVSHELRTTMIPSRHDAARLDRMARWARGCQRWVLQPCRTEPTRPFAIPPAAPSVDLGALAQQLSAKHGLDCEARGEPKRLSPSSTLSAARLNRAPGQPQQGEVSRQ
jgi:pyruvate formate lyase activating enzyme